MEEASGKDLSGFFEQWLFRPGTLKYQGNWRYDGIKKEITINLDQIQNDGSLFKMPLEIEIHYPGQSKTRLETIQVDAKSNIFTFKTSEGPEKIILDPNKWVLMDADFREVK